MSEVFASQSLLGTRHDAGRTAMAHPLLSSGTAISKTARKQVPMAAQQQAADALRRVRGEYTEMPGLRLTSAQAQRLWGLDRASCDALLGALVEAKFLFRTRDGAFVRSEYTTRAARS